MDKALFTPYTRQRSNDPDEQKLRDHAGQIVDATPSDPNTFDAEVGQVYDVTFPDGYQSQAFEDELTFDPKNEK